MVSRENVDKGGGEKRGKIEEGEMKKLTSKCTDRIKRILSVGISQSVLLFLSISISVATAIICVVGTK